MRERSTKYPSISLMAAITAIEKIKSQLGNVPVDRKTIANALGYGISEKGKLSGVAARKVSSLQYYGLIKKNKNQYSLSELAHKIILPLSEDEKMQALQEAVKNPKLYSDLIKAYQDTGIPKMLPTILERNYGITNKAAPKVAHDFEKSISFSKLLHNKENSQIEDSNSQKNQQSSEHESGGGDSKDSSSQLSIQNPNNYPPINIGHSISISFPFSMMEAVATGKFTEGISKIQSIADEIMSKQPSKS